MIESAQLILLGILLGAFFVGTVMGFGTTIITITCAAQFMSIEAILSVIAPLNLSLSIYLAVRHRRTILWRPLVRRIIPAVGFGVPFGLLLFTLRHAQWLRVGFGIFVMTVAFVELRRALTPTGSKPLPRWASIVVLGLGGMMHGLFNTGGPLIVYALGREVEDKSEFRSTVAALFVVLTSVLVTDYIIIGLVTLDSAKISVLALVPVVVGISLGEIAHHRLDARSFKRALWGLLLIGGVILTVRAVA